VAVEAPAPVVAGPLRRLISDVRDERALEGGLPPGPTDFSWPRTFAVARNPLPILLDAYREHGPIFSIRILHASSVFMLGPEANHYVTVSSARNFEWRKGSFRDLIPFLGDGLLTTDGDYHRRSRRIMLPAFHRERLEAATATMVEEAGNAVANLTAGETVDLYTWTRELAMRIAMKALFGLDPDRGEREADLAHQFERGLSFYGRDYLLQVLRGPKTPWAHMLDARRRIDGVLFDEIARRRARRDHGTDILGLLMDARDADGWHFTDRQLRDQVMTLLFAGHDTTTSTVTFLFYELARAPHELDALLAEHDELVGDRSPTATELATGLPRLDMALDETLRLYPPAWIGPRRAREGFEFGGYRIPAGAHVNYCSWASHHIPEVFPAPEAFVPERFSPDNKARLVKGAYVPFGGGSRTCIGMRFGQLEIKAIAAAILRRFRLELQGGYTMSVRQMPTLSPRGGLPVVVRERGADPLRT
jgi:cytochrome P450